MDCVFCKIAAGTIPGEILYRDEEIIAFRDIQPQAPSHVLIIPREHIVSLDQVSETKSALIGRMANLANQLAKSEGIAEKGYRVVINCGSEGGQVIPHLHMHLLGGRQLSGRMG